MASLNSSVASPNLSPPTYTSETHLSYQGTVSKYAAAGALAVLIWDILDNVPRDYRLLFGNQRTGKRMSFAMVAYISSRVAALGYSLTSVIFSTAPIGNCELVDRLANAWCPLSVAATGYLFFIRLRAIYNRNRVVIAAFFVLWLGLAAGGIFIVVGVKGGPSARQNTAKTFPWHILCSTIAIHEEKTRIENLLFGTNLPAFTKSLLQDGQIYYLITIVAGVSSMALMFRGLVRASPLSGMMEDVYLVLVNIMACRVFRRTRAGKIRESEISTSNIIEEPIKFSDADGDSKGTV